MENLFKKFMKIAESMNLTEGEKLFVTQKATNGYLLSVSLCCPCRSLATHDFDFILGQPDCVIL